MNLHVLKNTLKIGLKGLIPGCKVCWAYHNHKGPKPVQKTNRTIILDMISKTGAEVGVRLWGLVSIRLWKKTRKTDITLYFKKYARIHGPIECD